MASVWGPPLWKEIHLKSLTLSTDEFITFLDSLPGKIPCPKCTRHYIAYRAEHPIRTSTDIVMWGIRFHNAVNLRIGKPVIPPKIAIEMIKRKNRVHRLCRMGAAALSLSSVIVLLLY